MIYFSSIDSKGNSESSMGHPTRGRLLWDLAYEYIFQVNRLGVNPRGILLDRL